jgi:hypothetical protein
MKACAVGFVLAIVLSSCSVSISAHLGSSTGGASHGVVIENDHSDTPDDDSTLTPGDCPCRMPWASWYDACCRRLSTPISSEQVGV